MPSISGAASVALGFRMSPLRIGEGMEGAESLGVCRVRLPDFGDRRNDFSGYADSIACVVSRDVVGDDPEERCQRFGSATSAGVEKV